MADKVQSGSGAEAVTYDAIIKKFQADVLASKNDPKGIDSAVRNLVVAAQRNRTMDKRFEALAKVFDAKPELITKLSTQMQDLANSAAQGSVQNENKRLQTLTDYANLLSTTNFKNDARIEEAKGGFYETVAVIGEFCHVIGFEQGAQYCKRFVNEWKANNTVAGKPTELEALSGTLTPEIKTPLSLLQSTTGVALDSLGNGLAVIQSGADALGEQVSQGNDTGVLFGDKLNQPATSQSQAESVIKKIGSNAKWSAEKIDSLVGAYKTAAGSDGILQKDEATQLSKAAPIRTLKPAEKEALSRELVTAHMAPEGTLWK